MNPTLALLLFHLRVGVRVAIRASPPLFCGIVAMIMLQDPPSGEVAAVARASFSGNWPMGVAILIAGIAFVLPAWARPRLSEGLDGWVRHLPFNNVANRTGFLLALLTAQLPLAVMIGLLGVVAARMGIGVRPGAIRWLVVLVAGAAVSLPLRRRFSTRRSRRWRSAGVLITWRIAWRALDLRVMEGVAFGLLSIGAGRLFIINNNLRGAPAAAAARMAGLMACTLCLASLAKQLAKRRPAWPLARSFPWSSIRRVADDSLFLGLHALPFVALAALQSPGAALFVLAGLPLLSVRAAEYVRRIPTRRMAPLAFAGEGVVISIAVTLLPWSSVLCAGASILAIRSGVEVERRLKTTTWFELHRVSVGDTSSWSE